MVSEHWTVSIQIILRDMQSYVTQDTIMFHDTIFNNVHIANLEASVSDVERACKKANIHDFIMSLPKEYETSVAELGSSLSAGERRKNCLSTCLPTSSTLYSS